MPDGETGPRSDWIVWQYPVLSSRPEFEVCPPGARLASRTSPAADQRRRVDRHAAVRAARLRAGRHDVVSHLRSAQARRADPDALPVPGVAADATRADRRVRRTRGPGSNRAALRGGDDGRALDDLRRDPPRSARGPVGHELRVRHARRRHADVVRRPAVQHRRAPRAARTQRAGRRPARLPLLPRPRAPPPRAPARRAAARRDRERALPEPQPFARLDPLARAGRSRRRPLLRDARAAAAAARDASSTSASSTSSDGVAGAKARIVAAQRFVHDFGVATDCGWGRHRPQDVATLVELHRAVTDAGADRRHAAAPFAVARRVGSRVPDDDWTHEPVDALRHRLRQRRPPRLVPQPRSDRRGAGPPADRRRDHDRLLRRHRASCSTA